MRKLFFGFCLVLLMSSLTAVLANANYHIEPVSKDSNGVWAQNITFDKSLDVSRDFKVSGNTVWSYRINLQTKSTVKVIINGNYLDAQIYMSDGTHLRTLDWAKSDKNGTKMISQVLYSGIYYIGLGCDVPDGTNSTCNIRIVINPV